jgi:pimeloyl-ACP methyl ester carboxylesterase
MLEQRCNISVTTTWWARDEGDLDGHNSITDSCRAARAGPRYEAARAPAVSQVLDPQAIRAGRRSVTTTRDGITWEAIVHVPACPPRVIAIVFHPMGLGPEAVLDGEPAGDRLIRSLDGLRPAAEAHGLAVVAPRGRGRADIDGVSMAWEPYLRMAVAVARQLREDLGDLPIVAGGLSQGGLEALVLAGLEPSEIRAVWAVNAPIDIARLRLDRQKRATRREASSLDRALIEELGGDRRQWAARTPLAYLASLAKVDRIQLVWSPDDAIVPDADAHSGRLADELRALGSPIDERRVTFVPPRDGLDPGRYAHESCDVWSGAAFLSGAGG